MKLIVIQIHVKLKMRAKNYLNESLKVTRNMIKVLIFQKRQILQTTLKDRTLRGQLKAIRMNIMIYQLDNQRLMNKKQILANIQFIILTTITLMPNLKVKCNLTKIILMILLTKEGIYNKIQAVLVFQIPRIVNKQISKVNKYKQNSQRFFNSRKVKVIGMMKIQKINIPYN